MPARLQERVGTCRWLVRVLVAAVLTTFVVVVILFRDGIAERLIAERTDAMPRVDVTYSRLPAVEIPFTSAELDYVKYGEGTTELVGRRDERYMKLIRSQIAKPSPKRPRKIDGGTPGQHEKAIEQLLGGRRNGFFVECGANDGQFQSNTVYFEEKLNWTGLLVEANPRLARALLSRNRKAFVYPGCLSPRPRPAALKFKSAGCCGGLTDHLSASQEYVIQTHDKVESIDLVQCYPLSDLLAAIGVNHVDYLALDVHGAELPVLKTIDFHQLRVDFLTVDNFDRNLTVRLQMAEEVAKLFAATGLYKAVDATRTDRDLLIERINATTT